MTNMSVIHNYTDKKKFNNTSYNNDKERFLTYNLSDINGNKTKEIKLRINEPLNSTFMKIGKYNFNSEDNKINNINNKIQSLSHKNINNEKIKNIKHFPYPPLKNTYLKKNLSDIFYKNKKFRNTFLNIKNKYLPLIKNKQEKFNVPWIFINSLEYVKKKEKNKICK